MGLLYFSSQEQWLLLVAGSCQFPNQAQVSSYQTCAIAGGAQLVNGSLIDLGKARFGFKPSNCSYSSESGHPSSSCALLTF